MRKTFIAKLRNLAATLLTLSGIAHIAALWLRELDGAALADALLGAVYLIIGIGLFGQSRFSLFMAIVVPAVAAALVFNAFPDPNDIYRARIAVEAIVVLSCTVVLWSVRKNPSV
jgi:hypothetical protein